MFSHRKKGPAPKQSSLRVKKKAAYNHQRIERKWTAFWEKSGIFKAKDFDKKPKFYGLIEFPYPSGEGLHVGHVRSYTGMDVISRKKRMQGFNVLYPIGWDAFGLPTENYAIKTGIHPKIVTKKNTDIFRRQLKSLGFSFDWDREINTTDPKYYKWTQWIFLQFFKKRLAYKRKMPINWCPSCKIGLANEEVINGSCERCGTATVKKEKEQWLLAITKYADRLLRDLDAVDYSERIKIQQANWIGKSEGALLKFPIVSSKLAIDVFTTRPDTLFGATYMVLSPEHELIEKFMAEIKNWPAVKKYIETARRKSDLERTELTKDKTGVELKGIAAINPATKKEIPIWIADYVLASYGTGAIMAVPAHDYRDLVFAQKYNIQVLHVVDPKGYSEEANKFFYWSTLNYPAEVKNKLEYDYKKIKSSQEVYSSYIGRGILINSGKFDGMDSEVAKWEITKFVGGKKTYNYHLRDWIFSRQHYWGEPIPIIICPKCALRDPLRQGLVPVPEKDLPVELPNVKNYKPTDTGESPLESIKSWVNVKCPKCGEKARRETDTMPNWAGSSWYFLRYTDPENNQSLADMEKLKYWMAPARQRPKGVGGVDWYNGGMEHTTLHLLYSRFWNKFLFDIGVVPVSEPYAKRTSHGVILSEDGSKMSKSKGNVVNPDFFVSKFGADALRIYEMFMGPFDQMINWNSSGVNGAQRFLLKIWNIAQGKKILKIAENTELEKLLNKTIKKVGDDIESMNFNTAVSSLMIFVNRVQGEKEISKSIWERFLLILAPFAPFLMEELWEQIGNKPSIHRAEWPAYDRELLEDADFELIIQVNGKVRDKVRVRIDIPQKEAEEIVRKRDRIRAVLGKHKVQKMVFVPNRLINIVI